MTRKVFLITGGGSGGHVYPLLAVTEKLKSLSASRNWDLDIHYMGVLDAWSAILLEVPGIKFHRIASAKIRRYFSIFNLFALPKFIFSSIQALIKMYWIMPDAIFSKGGTGALPVVLAGWFYRIPIIVHESDSVPGASNLLSGKFAKKVFLSFENAMNFFNPKKTLLVGHPLRQDLVGNSAPQDFAKEEMGFSSDKPLLLVLGGSQGSKRINEFILINLSELLRFTQVLHQTGPDNFLEVEKLSKAALSELSLKENIDFRYQCVPFLTGKMKTAYEAADVVVSRSGSGTIFEIAAFGKPSILIPLPESAGDHQRLNAIEFSQNGSAVIIEENNLIPSIFQKTVKEILGNAALKEKMGQASASFFKPGAVNTITEESIRIAGW